MTTNTKKKRSFANSFLLLTVLLSTGYISIAQPGDGKALQRVVIIRHGEKPETGENLSCQGFNRATQLAQVLYAKFKIPDYVFVPSVKTGKSTAVVRMYQTIMPFAVKYNVSVNTKYAVDDAAGLALSVLKKNGTVLVVWEHNNIPQIAQSLGIKEDNLKWKGDDFDTIWIVTFKNGKALLSRDKENLHPSASCSY